MRKFFLKLSYFCIPLLIIAILTDYLISINLKKSKDYAAGELLVWNDIYNGKINSDIVIYGSSRAWVHINPIMIENAFHKNTYNLGIDGHNFWLQYLRHKELLKYNKKPKYILISLDVFTLEKNTELYNLNQFLPYIFKRDIYEYTSIYKGFSFWDYKLPLVRYIGNKEAIKVAYENFTNTASLIPARVKGYMGMNRKWNNDLKKAKANKIYYEIKIDSATKILFNIFLQECKNNKITVILVYSPEYIEGQKYVKNRASVIRLYEHFAKKYNILFLNYSNDELCKKREYFYNASHLNKTGSEIFTKKLIADLENIIPSF